MIKDYYFCNKIETDMNNLPFGNIDYRQFKNTFLATVLMGMNFPTVQSNDTRKKEWKDYCQALFSLNGIDGIFEKTIVINRDDQKLKFLFGSNLAQVLISGDGYRNFADTVIPHAFKLKQFVTDVAGCEHPSLVGIRKIDIFQIEGVPGMSFDEAQVRSHFFSEDYLGLKDGKTILDENERQMPQMVKHVWTEGDHSLTVRSVFMKVQGKDNLYQLVFDSEEHYSPIGGIDLSKLDEILKDINKDLYNAYMWCVSDKVKNIMEKGKE